jgi:tetratricopeptide (TPR) repeat protein
MIMGDVDWYRKTEWSQEIQLLFFERLKRIRKDTYKSQYLRIQAYMLQCKASPPLYQAAIELIDYLIKEYPDPTQLASAYLQKAQCLEAIGQVNEATQSYLSSMKAQENCPNFITNAPIDFALFVIRHKLTHYYDIVLAQLEHVDSLTQFPVGQYQANAAIAIILFEKGKKRYARQFAQNALDAAEKEYSGFRYHPSLGLVDKKGDDLICKVEKIAKC